MPVYSPEGFLSEIRGVSEYSDRLLETSMFVKEVGHGYQRDNGYGATSC